MIFLPQTICTNVILLFTCCVTRAVHLEVTVGVNSANVILALRRFIKVVIIMIIIGCSTPFRKDRTSKGGGILLYVREDIPCKIIKTETDAYHESFFIEINLRKKRMVTKLFLQFT